MRKLIITIAIVAGLAFTGLGLYNKVNALNTESVNQETALNQHYQSDQLELDTYVKTIKESVGIANVKSDKLDQILRDAVSGRYGDTKDGVRNGQGGAFMLRIATRSGQDAVLAKAHFWQRFASTPFNPRHITLLNRLLDGFDGKLTTRRWARA